jgi:c-di-GMP-binding flagellar brake protein YcgR
MDRVNERVQRRRHARYHIWFPVRVDAGELEGAMAVNHNIGAGGMLIALSAELKAGSEVKVTFRLPPDGKEERHISGRIVRIEKNDADPDGVWPFRMAVAFDQIASDLVPLLEKAVHRISEII